MIQKLRNNEYFGMQDQLDNLYEESANGRYFKNLYDFIVSEENIRLAYRNIKSNTEAKQKAQMDIPLNIYKEWILTSLLQ